MDAPEGQDGDAVGTAFALVAVIIWAAWLPATRVAIADGLNPVDIALLRYAFPAIMLAPVWWRIGLKPKGVPFSLLFAMFCWGAPFVLVLSAAMERASVAHAAAMVPCTMPVLAAAASWIVYRQGIQKERRIGIMLIGFAAFCVLVSVLTGDSRTDLSTIGLLLLASAGWAAYTVAYRRSGLSAVEAAAVVFAWSAALLVPLALLGDTGLTRLSLPSMAFHITSQGVLSGFAATILYGFAINRLGVSRAASFSVLVPVLATVLAFFWLGEIPSFLDSMALAIGTLGVAVVNGAISFSR